MNFNTFLASSNQIDLRYEASSVLGWISVACWIIVYTPQFIENYRLKSGEGVSVMFVAIWLLGDITNLAGALMAGLLPTVIILALYYTVCDIGLLMQIYYYRVVNPALHQSSITDETTPLLINANEEGESSPDRKDQADEDEPLSALIIRYSLMLAFVVAVGFSAWFYSRMNRKDEPDTPSSNTDILDWRSQAIGWTSAIMYLGARIPQITKNMQTKCEGLSLALFVFSISGNVTYALSICVVSTEWHHILVNSSWLAGSTLTIILDLFVVSQFFRFRAERLAEKRAAAISSA